ncbi:peroxiredoxin family protein [Steroidobacter sp.]|uniref:peroxiredoxin family protein n=1 Tax=Steroidobacter sp. TaxID=1978227 RepID=UPI001A374C0C|nr:TlpA disulfide reductase family protein [Steroidobacter sp.]MBL8267139.1 TlpA family protein disulfide reductase [Steroidobacter sp.]
MRIAAWSSARSTISPLVLAGLLATLAACGRPVDEPQTGTYRATLELPGGVAPVGLEVSKVDTGFVLYLVNAAERTRVDNVTLKEGELAATFPGYENTLRAKMYRDRLEGTVTLIKADSKEQVIPFQATRGDSYRFYKEALTDNADLAGHWEMTLTSDGKTTAAVAIFEQQHDRVTGTVMTPTGDHRYLEGQVHGDEAQLSTFAGGLAYLYKLKVNKAGDLEGEMWQGLASHSQVKASRNDNATLDGIGPSTQLKDQTSGFDFTFRDVDGKEVSLHDEKFRGKVVVVTLGGSWCPNCHDEAMFLVPFYKEYQPKGVEIVALMFERHGEFERAAQAVRGYRKDLGIEFTTLIAGVSDTDEASKALPTLTGVYGYPTTLVVDRTGKVRDTHVGFSGPATGKHYEDYVAEFTALIEQLLAETPATTPASGV